MVKKGEPATNFDMGEFDLEFNDKSLTVKYPNLKQDVYDVSTVSGNDFILHK